MTNRQCLYRIRYRRVHGNREGGNSTESAVFPEDMGMNVAGIPRDGSEICGIPAVMDSIMTRTPREWSVSPYGILERPFYLRVCDVCL